MRYSISHTTTYHYNQAVKLAAHTVRLCPRCDGVQSLKHFAIEILPEPSKVSNILDLEGNTCLRLWFADAAVTQLRIHATSEVETLRTNPFDYLCEPWATQAPLDYPSSLAAYLTPYLKPARTVALNPQVVDLAQSLMQKTEGNVGLFLTQLAQTIHGLCQYTHRPIGKPQAAEVTLSQRSGSCRDFAVLYMAACQAVGLAARFTSGYQEGDEDWETHELHAWSEVYIPGGGWRGFDPTHGLAVADRHIALAAAAYPEGAAPVSGKLRIGDSARSTLDYQVEVTKLD